jgi:hypothetical protein
MLQNRTPEVRFNPSCQKADESGSYLLGEYVPIGDFSEFPYTEATVAYVCYNGSSHEVSPLTPSTSH